MPTILGVDGCKGGWCYAESNTDKTDCRFGVVSSAQDLLELSPRLEVIAIDIPIGLTENGKRDCDCQARTVLGKRGVCVFPAPVRGALAAQTLDEASQLTRKSDGRGVSVQAWGIFPKVREVDHLLRRTPDLQSRIREIHPEVSFWAWSGQRAIKDSKKSKEGLESRRLLVEPFFGNQVLNNARKAGPKSIFTDDDILDSFAALWTALRIWRGEAQTLPEHPSRDATGLMMEIVY